MALLDHYGIPLTGRRAVILDLGALVGRPLAALLTTRVATVTVCHSRTRDLAAVCREADLLVAAIGRTGFVTGEYVREGRDDRRCRHQPAGVVENAPENLRRSVRLRDTIASRGRAIVGDVDFEEVSPDCGGDHTGAGAGSGR